MLSGDATRFLNRNEPKLLALSKLIKRANIKYNMFYLLSKKCFQNRPIYGKMKQDISETISQAYSPLLQAYCLKKTQCHNPIISCPVIENSKAYS